MKVTKEMKIGLLAMVSLRLCKETKSAMDLAEEHSVEKSFVEKVFSKLRRSGLVDVVKGPGGGYKMGKDSNPTVWMVFDVLVNKSLKDSSLVGKTNEVSYVNSFLNKTETEFVTKLKETHLSDVVKKTALKVA